MKRSIYPTLGILRDPSVFALPQKGKGGVIETALSDGEQIFVRDGKLRNAPGYRSIYGTPSGAPLWLIDVVLGGTTDHLWVYADDADIYVVDEANTHTEISKSTGAYSAAGDSGWTGDLFGNVLIMNNPNDIPQQWTVDYTVGSNAADMTSWASDLGTGALCKGSMRSFRQYIIAMHTEEGSTGSTTEYPQRVRWSDKGSPGSTPGWDDTGNGGAGSTDLLESYDPVIDGQPLRDSFVVYKDNETILMRLVGGKAVMGFRTLFKTSGILTRHCAKEYRGNHFVLTQGDFVVHDGNEVRSLIDKKQRRWLFNAMDPVAWNRSFVVVNEQIDEVWVCFPENGSTNPTRALTYSLQDGTFGDRVLPGVRYIATGELQQSSSGSDWDSDTDSWDSDTTRWDEAEYNPAEQKLLMAGTDDTKLYEVGNDQTADGTAIKARAVRESDDFGDPDRFKTVNRVKPVLTATEGTVFTIRIGSQLKASDSITWTERTFTYGTDEEVSLIVKGKFISWEISTEEDTAWELTKIDFEFTTEGHQ